MAKHLNKQSPPKRKRSGPNRIYWAVFALCSIVSFAAGFYVTYHGTRVAVKEPPIAADPAPSPTVMATEAPVYPAAGEASASPPPVDPFAVGVEASPTPAPVESAATPESAPMDEASKATEPDKAAPLREDGQAFRVQVGSYDSQASAQSMVDELAGAGVRAIVVQDSAGQYHAQIGAYTKRDRALSMADEVNAKGYSVTIRQ